VALRLQVQAIFDQMDTDKDGNIDSKELRKALKAFGYSLSDAEVDQLMSRMDLNMDGVLFLVVPCSVPVSS
jgi:Ca2+-binding EF-hand superfamily protein